MTDQYKQAGLESANNVKICIRSAKFQVDSGPNRVLDQSVVLKKLIWSV